APPAGRMELIDGLLETLAADEPHRVIGPAVAMGPQAVDRHNPRVLESAGNLSLQQEPLAAGGVVGVVVEDLLQRHLAMQILVGGDEDGPRPAGGVGPEDAEPLAVACGSPDGVGAGSPAIAVGAGADVGDAGPGHRPTGGGEGPVGRAV